MSTLRVVPVACLKDNYAYLVVCETTKQVAVVDPSEAPPVIAALAGLSLTPRAIWNTHHHFDHTGGNEELARHFGIEWVSGHASDRGRIAGQTRFLEAGERFTLGELDVHILHIPGHTLGAIAYVVRSKGGDVALFSHGHLLRVLAARWLGLPAVDGHIFGLDAASVSVLGHEHGAPVIQLWNQPPAA